MKELDICVGKLHSRTVIDKLNEKKITYFYIEIDGYKINVMERHEDLSKGENGKC